VRIYEKSHENRQKQLKHGGKGCFTIHVSSPIQPRITRGIEESTRDDGNYTGYTHRSNTKRHIMDCQLGNPCEIVCDPRATIHSPMIKEMEGTD
ncbi:hypothetical protein Tco_1139832, partial [Tanacetum coccineum]